MKPDVAVDPILWDKDRKRIRAGKVSGSIGNGNTIHISGPTEQFKVMLRPQEGIDLAEQVVIRFGSGSRAPARFEFDGSLETMLEDARQRADRKRPFWVTVTVP